MAAFARPRLALRNDHQREQRFDAAALRCAAIGASTLFWVMSAAVDPGSWQARQVGRAANSETNA